MNIFKSGLMYFVCVFGAGVVLGSVRVGLLVSRLGVRWAELLEMPFMFAVVVLAARWIVRRFQLASGRTRLAAPCVRLVVAFNFIHGRAAAQSDAAGVRSSWLVLLSMEDRERGQ